MGNFRRFAQANPVSGFVARGLVSRLAMLTVRTKESAQTRRPSMPLQGDR